MLGLWLKPRSPLVAFNSIAFLDDRCCDSVHQDSHLGWPVIGPFSIALDPQVRKKFSSVLVATGNPSLRVNWLPRLASFGYEVPVVVHPTAWVSPPFSLALARWCLLMLQSSPNL